jgi:hypothetical protein
MQDLILRRGGKPTEAASGIRPSPSPAKSDPSPIEGPTPSRVENHLPVSQSGSPTDPPNVESIPAKGSLPVSRSDGPTDHPRVESTPAKGNSPVSRSDRPVDLPPVENTPAKGAPPPIKGVSPDTKESSPKAAAGSLPEPARGPDPKSCTFDRYVCCPVQSQTSKHWGLLRTVGANAPRRHTLQPGIATYTDW